MSTVTGYTLVNFAEVRECPEHKHLVAPADLVAQQGKGSYVQLQFGSGKHTESMWVQVTSTEGDTWVGRLANDPVNTPALKFNDEIRFSPENVRRVLDPNDQPYPFPEPSKDTSYILH